MNAVVNQPIKFKFKRDCSVRYVHCPPLFFTTHLRRRHSLMLYCQ